MGKILVTGANGFVGQRLVARLLRSEQMVVAIVRAGQSFSSSIPNTELLTVCEVDDIGAVHQYASVLSGVKCIIHLAARVHVMKDNSQNPLNEFRRVNVEGTRAIVEAAQAYKVSRFIYVSSIKVNGDATIEVPFAYDSSVNPIGPYAISKLEAEELLRALGRNIDCAIVRPPLVYGPGAKANLHLLERAIRAGVPLPLKAVKNRRTMLYVDNFVDAMLRLAFYPSSIGGTYAISDDQSISIGQLVSLIARALGRNPRLFSIPIGAIRAIAVPLGLRGYVERLLQSLEVDNSEFKRRFDWVPPFSTAEGIRASYSCFPRLM